MPQPLTLHPLIPGMWCVPSALYVLTGADPDSVIHPALNRHTGCPQLTRLVVGSTVAAARATLTELGYTTRRYKGTNHRLSTWATLSRDKYPSRVFFLGVKGHVLVVLNGSVYDTFTPHGALGATHPYATALVTSAYLVEKGR